MAAGIVLLGLAMALVLWKFEPARIHLPSIGFAVAVVPGLVVASHRRANLPAADVALVARATITVLAMTGPWFSMDKAIRFYLIALLPAHLSKPVGVPAEWAEQLDRLGLEAVPKAAAAYGLGR